MELALHSQTPPCFQVILIHSRVGLADPELLPSVRQQAKEVLLEKGVELLLGKRLCLAEGMLVRVTQYHQSVKMQF